MSSSQSMRRSRQILSVVIVFFWASEYCHVPYFTPYLTMLGFGASAIGVMTGTYGFTQMLVRIPLGIATDATGGYRRVVLMGTIFTTVSSFGLMFATSAAFIIFCRFLAGVAASTWLAFSVLYSAYYDPEEGVQAMTSINVFNNTGKLLAFILGTIVATAWGYRYPLAISFLTGVVAVILALQLKEVPIQKEPMRLSVLAHTFCNSSVLLPALFAIVLQMVVQGTAFSFTSTVAEGLGATSVQIGINTALFTVVQVVAGGWLGKHFTPRLGTTKSVAAGFLLLTASCGIIAAAGSVWQLFLAQLLGGTGNILLMSILMALAIKRVPAENKSTAMGLFQALYG
ncbi:MAG: MFS transporter, partial [Lachnospiraceae bacterium]|nr:MFS transporter [Lachnospiraceae bacterium]